MIACSACGAANLPNTLFCDQCGGELRSHRSPPGSAAWRRPLRCYLPASGTSFDLPSEAALVFGRADQSVDLHPDVDLGPFGAVAAGVSRRHARILQRHDGLSLEDLDSLNGTYVNGVRLLPHRPARLSPGAVVRLGRLELRLEECD